MKLDRNKNPDGLGKYALILNRKVTELQSNEVSAMLNRLHELGVLDMGDRSPFFVLRHRDIFAFAALKAYAREVRAWALEAAKMIHEPGKTPEDREALQKQKSELFEYAAEIDAEAFLAKNSDVKLPT